MILLFFFKETVSKHTDCRNQNIRHFTTSKEITILAWC